MKTINATRLISDRYVYHNGLIKAEDKVMRFIEDNYAIFYYRSEIIKNSSLHNTLSIHTAITMLVTAIEMFYKLLIRQHNGWKAKGMRSLLNQQINLADAYKLFGTEEVTEEYIISETHNFQDFKEISRIMSALTGITDFNKSMEIVIPVDAYEKKQDAISLVKKYPKWQDQIKEIIAMRHKFVHTGQVDETVNVERLGNYYRMVTVMVLGVTHICKRYRKKAGSKN